MGMGRVLVRPGGLGDSLLLAPALAILRSTEPTHVTLVGYSERLQPLVDGGLADCALGLDAWLARKESEADQDVRIDSFFPLPHEGVIPHPPFPEPGQPLHTAEYIGRRLNTLELNPSSAPLERLIRVQDPSSRKPILWVHPGAGSREKRWSIERFLELVEDHTRRGGEAQFLLGEADEDLAEPLRTAGKAPVFPSEIRNLPKLWTTGDLFLGNDSGPTHLAALCGLPTLAVFGPTDPAQWRPWGPRAAFIRAEGGRGWPSSEQVKKKLAAMSED